VKGADHVGNKRVAEFGEQLALVLDSLDALLHYDDGFGHLLHRVELVRLAILDFPDLSISALAHHFQKVELRAAEAFLTVSQVEFAGPGERYVERRVFLLGIVYIDDICEAALDLLLDLTLLLGFVVSDFLLSLSLLFRVRIADAAFGLAYELLDVAETDFGGELGALEHLVGLARRHPGRRRHDFFMADIGHRTFGPEKGLSVSRSDHPRTLLLGA
jgi:hypothetical protein